MRHENLSKKNILFLEKFFDVAMKNPSKYEFLLKKRGEAEKMAGELPSYISSYICARHKSRMSYTLRCGFFFLLLRRKANTNGEKLRQMGFTYYKIG